MWIKKHLPGVRDRYGLLDQGRTQEVHPDGGEGEAVKIKIKTGEIYLNKTGMKTAFESHTESKNLCTL
jgi:hypothetical protein